MARTIGCKVFFDWDFNGTFTEETTNLVSASADRRFTPPDQAFRNGQGIVDQCEIILRNVSGRYSALNTSGALYAYIQAGGIYHVPMYVELAIDGSTYTRVFTGVTKIPKETGAAYEGIPTVRFDCRSRDELLLQQRISTTQSGFRTRHDDGFDEAQIITAFVNAGGVGVGDREIDPGIISIPWSYIDDESVLEDVWALAAAAGGRIYCDEDGILHYENLAHWLFAPHRTSQATYTTADWQTADIVYDDTNLYNSVSVEYAGRKVEPEGVLWEPDDLVRVPAYGSKTIVANFSYPAWETPTITYKAHTAGGIDMTAYVSVTATWYAQRASLVVTNTHTTLGAQLGAFQIVGRPVMGGPSADELRTSADDGTNEAFFAARVTDRNLSIRGNFYVQSRAQAGMIAQFLLDRYEKPMLTYNLRGMLGDPARVPGDRITINDTSMMSAGRAAMVIAVSWRYSGMSYRMDIEAIDAAALYPYLGTSPSYFIINTNELGAADPQRGRVFY